MWAERKNMVVRMQLVQRTQNEKNCNCEWAENNKTRWLDWSVGTEQKTKVVRMVCRQGTITPVFRIEGGLRTQNH